MYENAVRVLEQYYINGWTTYPTKFENKRFDEPKGSPWVHFEVLFGDSQNIKNCGGVMKYRQAGLVMLRVNVPYDMGSQKAYEISDKFVNLFANKTIGSIIFRTPFVSIPERGKWYRNRVSIPFEIEN